MILGNNTFLKDLQKSDLPQDVIFWDTSLPASAIFKHDNHLKRKAAQDFIERLIKEGAYIAFSSVLLDEFTHIAIRNELMKSQ